MASLVDIEFTDLNYTAGLKKIIKCVSGHFRGGELSVIMGPSGAGKSTLMNILVGYVTSGVSGVIRTNGEPRRLAVFNKLSSYIMQEDLLQPLLTVRESMSIAAHLKLGGTISKEDKDKAVNDILKTLGLSKCADTFTSKLSGGQRKRVAVALELVNNPPVIFLDEPTTGLDVVAMKQTVELLQILAKQGRTVICTIHQPSASLFHKFDHVYMVSEGKCVYQGPPRELVQFLDVLGYQCPETYNPADYVFEILTVEVTNKMCDEIQNGKLVMTNQGLTHMDSLRRENLMSLTNSNDVPDFPISFFEQFKHIFCRMMIQKRRHKGGLWLQVIHHIFSALIIGAIFQGVGNNARRPYENFKFVLCISVFFMYTYCMIPVLTYPTDMKLMKREFFNRWYSLKAYYLAKTLSTFPLITILGFVFTVITYFMADQPLEWSRFSWFALTCNIIALTSEGLGILIGFTFNCTNGAVVGPTIMGPILMVATHGMGYGLSVNPIMIYVMKVSYVRFAISSLITSLYLDNRILDCVEMKDDPFCYYKDAKLIVRDLAMEGEEPGPQLFGVIFYLLLFRTAAFFALRYRTRYSTQFANTLFIYMNKIIKSK